MSVHFNTQTMKKQIFNVLVIATLTLTTVGCKDNKENTVTPGEAQEAATASETAATYQINSEESTIEWRGTKPTGEHRGTIDIQSGTISATQEEIESGTVTIDMNSISVTDEGISDEDRTNLENHLKGTVEGKETDFFNVEEFPTATFEITGITEKDGQKMMQGNLTLKEDTKNIEFPVSTSVDDNEVTIKSETFTIDRTDWKVNYGSKSVFDNLGDNFISDEIELKIDVKATKK